MSKKICRSNSILNKKSVFAFTAGIIFSLSACKTIDSNSEHEFSSHVFNPVVFFSLNPPSNLKTGWPEIIREIEKKLREMPFLGEVVGLREQKQKFAKDQKLRSKLKTYLNTLSLTGISDKEIALKLEKEFGTEYFLFLEFLSFSCTKDCSSNKQWLIRLKLIESRSGDLIFWARKKYEISEARKNVEFYNDLAKKLSLEVVNEFASVFIIPWHQWRYKHFTKHSNQIDRKNIGI